MRVDAAARVVIRYVNLEEQLLDFFKHVPPQGINLRSWSPTLAALIKEACGLLESTLKHVTPATVQIEGVAKRRDGLKIQDLGVLYSKRLGLTKWKVILLNASPPEYRDPFRCWRNKVKRKHFGVPKWWTIHNRLKHDELTFMDQATANTSVDALAGLLLTVGAMPELTRALMQLDLLHWMNVSPDEVVNWALGGFPQHRPVILKTKLFAIMLGGRAMPKNIQDFRPLTHTRNHLLVPFFGRL